MASSGVAEAATAWPAETITARTRCSPARSVRQRATYVPSAAMVAVATAAQACAASSKRSIVTVRPAWSGAVAPRKRASLRSMVPARVATVTCGPAAVTTLSVAGGGGAWVPPVDGGSPAAAAGAANAAAAAHSSSIRPLELFTMLSPVPTR